MPQRILHLDYETFSTADIKAVGAYRYAAEAEILCAALALGDEEPAAWWEGCTHDLEKYWDALEDPDVLIYAHNAMFEAAISGARMWRTWGIRPPALHRYRCTMSLARRASLPSKLEKLAEVLGLAQQKDARGKSLIRKFSVMQPARRYLRGNKDGAKPGSIKTPPYRILPSDAPELFAEFVEYCRQDVRVEQAVHRKLAYFADEINDKNYSLDAVINARGVTVNLPALQHAQSLIEQETEIVSKQFRELCGFEVTQNARLLEWLGQQGVHLENLQAETIENFLETHDV